MLEALSLSKVAAHAPAQLPLKLNRSIKAKFRRMLPLSHLDVEGSVYVATWPVFCRRWAITSCPSLAPRASAAAAVDPHIYRGTLDGMRKIAAQEGVAALYRGTSASLLMVRPRCHSKDSVPVPGTGNFVAACSQHD